MAGLPRCGRRCAQTEIHPLDERRQRPRLSSPVTLRRETAVVRKPKHGRCEPSTVPGHRIDPKVGRTGAEDQLTSAGSECNARPYGHGELLRRLVLLAGNRQ